MSVEGDICVQAGAKTLRWRRPHRVVFGRRHRHSPTFGEDFWGLADLDTMSSHWFSVEDVTLTTPIGDQSESHAIRIRCESTTNSVLVWETRDPVRVTPGGSYLAQNDTLFVGDLIAGKMTGARIQLAHVVPLDGPARTARPGEPPVTVRPPPLELTGSTRDIVLARYHRYYRLPPLFDPQPTPWDDVVVILGTLDIRDSADKALVRRAQKDPQDAITRLKQNLERLHPGWLPESSGTQKTFHDHLRIILELHHVFDQQEIRAFDTRHPRAANHG